MAFTIYSGIPAYVVSVQTDDQGTFNVVGGQANPRAVNLGYAQVHVAGVAADKQAQRVVGVENGSRFEVMLVNNRVVVQPTP